MRFRLRRWTRWAVWLWLFGASVAHAHNPLALSGDPYGGLVVAELRPNRLELRVTMVRAIGLALAANTADASALALPASLLPGFATGSSAPPPIPAGAGGAPAADAAFEQARPILRQRAADIYQVFAAGSLLQPLEVEVALTPDGDIQFHYSYPLPARGPLRFRGVYLGRLPANHVDSLEVFDQAGQSVASGDLTPQRPSMEVTLPEPDSLFEKLVHVALALLVLAALIFGIRRLSRRAPGESPSISP